MEPRDPTLSIPLLLLLGGAGLVAWYAYTVLTKVLHVEALGAQFSKLLRAKNLDRAVKLSQAADYPVLVAARRVLSSLQQGLKFTASEGADYRTDAVDRSPDAVLAILRATYTDAYREASAPWQRSRIVGAVGAVLIVASIGLNARDGGAVWIYFAAAAGALLFAWALYRQHAQGSEGLAMFEGLRDELYSTATEVSSTAPATVPEPASGEGVRFEITEPGEPTRTVVVDKEIIKLGRMPTSHVVFTHESVARMHAVIEVARGEVSIIDLGGESGTRVNGERVNKKQLAYGDRVEFGPVQVIVRFDPARLPHPRAADGLLN